MFWKSMTSSVLFLSSFFAVMVAIKTKLAYGAEDSTNRKLKDKLIIANQILDMYNLAKPLGHISVRIPGTKTFLITRAVAPGMVTPDDVVICDFDGKVIQGKYPRTYGEVAAHTGVYRKREDINSVAHIHPPYVIALSMTEKPIVPASITSFTAGCEAISIFKKVMFIDTQAIGEEVADLLGPNNAVMLKGHGAVVVGKSLEECTNNAVALENAARLQLLASLAGNVVPLTEQEKQPLVDYLTSNAGSGATRAWDYYEFILKKGR